MIKKIGVLYKKREFFQKTLFFCIFFGVSLTGGPSSCEDFASGDPWIYDECNMFGFIEFCNMDMYQVCNQKADLKYDTYNKIIVETEYDSFSEENSYLASLNESPDQNVDGYFIGQFVYNGDLPCEIFVNDTGTNPFTQCSGVLIRNGDNLICNPNLTHMGVTYSSSYFPYYNSENNVSYIDYQCGAIQTTSTGTQGPPGPPGKDGADGIDGKDGTDGFNCWDTNLNHINDSYEDKNGDGYFNTLDCQGNDGADGQDGIDGTNGIDGVDGTNGIDGQDGTDGFNCWDINLNHVNDPNEDKNGDGYFNTLDCYGTSGIDGQDGADGKDGVDGIDGQNGETIESLSDDTKGFWEGLYDRIFGVDDNQINILQDSLSGALDSGTNGFSIGDGGTSSIEYTPGDGNYGNIVNRDDDKLTCDMFNSDGSFAYYSNGSYDLSIDLNNILDLGYADKVPFLEELLYIPNKILSFITNPLQNIFSTLRVFGGIGENTYCYFGTLQTIEFQKHIKIGTSFWGGDDFFTAGTLTIIDYLILFFVGLPLLILTVRILLY